MRTSTIPRRSSATNKTKLDQGLLKKIAVKIQKQLQYVRERTSRRAGQLSISSEAAQILWAKELGIGTGAVLRRQPPHIQAQVQTVLPSAFARPLAPRDIQPSKGSRKSPVASPIRGATEYLLADEELRGRCKDLLARRRHHDRAVREATTVLEDRIRTLSAVPPSVRTEDLVNRVLNSDLDKAILHVSQEGSVQTGFHSVCKGIFLAFRHPVHHSLDDDVTPEHALKVCGFIDVLLALLGTATRRPGA